MIEKIKKIHPLRTIFILGLVFLILIFFNPKKGVQYGDFGLMYIQVHDIINSGYSTFSLKYEGEKIDPDYRFFPYKKPFIGKVHDKHYIDFPPYFPLLNAPFYQACGTNGLYFLNFISLLLTLFLIYKLGELYELENHFIHLSLLLYSFGMTSTMYNMVFHEYPLGIFLITLSFYYVCVYYKKQTKFSLVLYGFIGGVSLYFRLEMIFVIIASGLSLALLSRKEFFKILLYSISGFIIPFLLLLYLNYYIHGHPLGLRYLLTLTDNTTPALLERIAIVQDMLFSSTRGFLYQSPFVIIILFAIFYYKRIFYSEKFLFIFTGIALVLILLTSPNHGDHRAPRYLFGMYPIFSLFSVMCYKSFLNYLGSLQDEIRNSYLGKYSTKILSVLFFLLIILSFKSTIQNYNWMQRASESVASFNTQFKQIAENNPIIYRDFSQPLNAQELYLNRINLVVENLDDLIPILENLKVNGNKKVIVSQFIPSEITSRNMVVEAYAKSLGLSKNGERYYFSNGIMNAKFNWMDLGKNYAILVLNIFLD